MKIRFETQLHVWMSIKNRIYLVNQTVFSMWLNEK